MNEGIDIYNVFANQLNKSGFYLNDDSTNPVKQIFIWLETKGIVPDIRRVHAPDKSYGMDEMFRCWVQIGSVMYDFGVAQSYYYAAFDIIKCLFYDNLI